MSISNIYDGLKLIELGKNRGHTDYAASADSLDLTEDDLRQIVTKVKGMYTREPNSTITVIEYCHKLEEAGLEATDVGIGEGKYQASRIDHAQPYTATNFKFELQTANLEERNERNSLIDHPNGQPVVTPHGEYPSSKAAAEAFGVDVKTINRWCEDGGEQYAGWWKKGKYPEKVASRLKSRGTRFWASDNISDVVDVDRLIDDLTPRFESVLRGLIIDVDNDPNSMGTAKRLAKMYTLETMSGRYTPAPDVTAFPNDDVDTRFGGMIVTRAEIVSMCSHHHQPVKGVAYIALLPSAKVIGLSKYARIAQWLARRGTLQEELTVMIADKIQKDTGCRDLAVYVQATHGCCENRGIMAHSSLTQTTELRGQFFNPSVKDEFLTYIQMQQQFAGNRV